MGLISTLVPFKPMCVPNNPTTTLNDRIIKIHSCFKYFNKIYLILRHMPIKNWRHWNIFLYFWTEEGCTSLMSLNFNPILQSLSQRLPVNSKLPWNLAQVPDCVLMVETTCLNHFWTVTVVLSFRHFSLQLN